MIHNACQGNMLVDLSSVYAHQRRGYYLGTPSEKYCPACKRTLSVDTFYKNKAQRDGLSCHCKDCMRTLNKKYKNKEKASETSQAYYLEHKEDYKRRNAEWREKNPERWRELSNRGDKAWKNKYPGRRAELNSAYRKRNPEVAMVVHANRKARKLGNGGSYTTDEWQQLLFKYDHTCLRCGRKEPEVRLTADHVIPLARGGTSFIDNIQPLCRECNSLKHAKTIDYRVLWENNVG